MIDFIKSALPWVIIGISIAVLAVYWASEKLPKSTETNERHPNGENYLGISVPVGLLFGVAIGLTILDLATGIALGMLLGVCVGIIKRK